MFVYCSFDHIDKLVHSATLESDAWQPLLNYRRILNDEPGAGHSLKARTSTGTRGRKRAMPQDGNESFIAFQKKTKCFLFLFR